MRRQTRPDRFDRRHGVFESQNRSVSEATFDGGGRLLVRRPDDGAGDRVALDQFADERLRQSHRGFSSSSTSSTPHGNVPVGKCAQNALLGMAAVVRWWA